MTAIAFNGSGLASIANSGTYASLSLTEDYDSSGWHDNSTNPHLMTVPQDGWYLLLGAFRWDTPIGAAACNARWLIDGTTVYGELEAQRNNLFDWTGCTAMQILLLTAGQTIELQQKHAAGTGNVHSSVQITRLPTPLFVGHNDIVGSTNNGVIAWTEDIDESGWHDDSTNPSRITIDTTGNYLIMGLALSPGTGVYQVSTEIKVNGSQAFFCYESVHDAGAGLAYVPMIAVMSLTAGDYVEMAKSIGVSYAQLAVARIDGVKAAHATLTTDIAGTGSFQQVFLDAETVDTDGFHSTSSNTDRMTIPSGKAGVYAFFSSLTSTAQVGSLDYVDLNTSDVSLSATCHSGGPGLSTKPGGNCQAYIGSVSVGDYFSRVFNCISAAAGRDIKAVGTYSALVCLDDFVYSVPVTFVPHIYRRL